MKNPSRKQREIQQRTDLILDIAKDLIAKEGFQNFRMDRIAEIAEYSKGTIYQHYSCKEEVLAHLCIRGMQTWKEFFERALNFRGVSREKLLAFHLGHDIYAKLFPIEYSGIYMVKSAGIREKVSVQTLVAIDASMQEIISLVVEVIDDAVSKHEVQLPQGMKSLDMVYCLWATHYGHLMFDHFKFEYTAIGINDRITILRTLLRMILDSMQWKPLSIEHDYQKVTERIYKEVFASEARQLLQLN